MGGFRFAQREDCRGPPGIVMQVSKIYCPNWLPHWPICDKEKHSDVMGRVDA